MGTIVCIGMAVDLKKAIVEAEGRRLMYRGVASGVH